MTYEFRDWFACPECGTREDVSTLAYRTEIVFECGDCGTVSEFAIGEHPPLRNLDVDAIEDLAGERDGE